MTQHSQTRHYGAPSASSAPFPGYQFDDVASQASSHWERSDSRAHTAQLAREVPQLRSAGVTSTQKNRALGAESKARQVDLSLLYSSQGPHPCGQKSDYTQSFKARVDPGTFPGAAGTTADKFTFAMVNKDDWEYSKKAQQQKAPKSNTHDGFMGCNADEEAHGTAWLDTRPFSSGKPKGAGECGVDPRTDPITHFKHEGIVFKDPWRNTRRSGYNTKATTQTWTWQTANEMDHHSACPINKSKVSRQVLDCRGRMHYISSGEEDMIPAATNAYIKCERKPTEQHVLRNDRQQLNWVHRNDGSPRAVKTHGKHNSNQMRDCMFYEYHLSSSVGDERSPQCSLRSGSEEPSPMRSELSPRRSVLSSCQSEPQFLLGSPMLRDDRAPLRSGESLASVTENVPPRKVERLEKLGSTASSEKQSYKEWRRSRESKRGSVTSLGSVTSRSSGTPTQRGPGTPGSQTARDAGPRRQSMTPSDASWR